MWLLRWPLRLLFGPAAYYWFVYRPYMREAGFTSCRNCDGRSGNIGDLQHYLLFRPINHRAESLVGWVFLMDWRI